MRRKNLLLTCLLAFSMFFAANVSVFAQSETLTNGEVISLFKAGLSSQIIINKIRTSKTDFDTSIDGLISLKQAGITDDIVAAMFEAKNGKIITASLTSGGTAASDPNDPMSAHDYGIYLFEDKNGVRKMTQLAPNVSAQNRVGGKVSAAIIPLGLGKIKTKANLPGTTAVLQVQTPRPTFYFYLDAKSGGLNTTSGIPSTPNEFALVRFNIRSDNREVTIAKRNAWGAKGGLSDEYIVKFEAENLGNGIYKITPNPNLNNGEYGFYLINSGNSSTGASIGAKFFDFGVKLNP